MFQWISDALVFTGLDSVLQYKDTDLKTGFSNDYATSFGFQKDYSDLFGFNWISID